MAEIEQNTAEWVQVKLGKTSASNIHKVMAKGKGTTRRNYLSQLAIEIVTGKSAEEERPLNAWNRNVQRGQELEPRARAAYELQCKEMVLTAGFIEHPRIPRAGCSPDALVGDVGLAQFKCPILAIHYDYIKAAKIQKVPSDYVAQVQFELACTGRDWNDFCSYNEQYPPDKRLIVIRAERDEAYIKELEAAVIEFNQEVDAMVADLRGVEPDMCDQLRASIALVQK